MQALGRAPVRKYAELEAKIQTIYEQHHGRYGYRRITVALREAGDAVNHKLVQTNEKWATGVTGFELDGAKLHLSAIIDLYNGEIVAHQTSRRDSLDMVQTTLGKAFARLNPGDTPMLHSDQPPSQFASMEKVERCLDKYIHYYNHERIKLRLDGLSPGRYRIREFGD